MAAAHGCSTVYASKRTKVSHLAENANSDSFCGIAGPWLGTGTQNEWDEAERRPLCTPCAGTVLCDAEALLPAVEQIVARHVAAALNAKADEIDDRALRMGGHHEAAYTWASRIVRPN